MKKGVLIIFLIVAGLTLTYLKGMVINTDQPTHESKSEEKVKERYAIQYCWEQYERKSLSDGEKRFIAGACEKMEDKFRIKYE